MASKLRQYWKRDINQRLATGELAQFEYASKAVTKSRNVVLSFIHPSENFAFGLSIDKVQSPLMIKFDKMINHYPSSKIASIAVGYPPDSHMISKCINEFIQDFVQLYGSEPSLVYLSNKVSDLMISGMYKSGDSQLTRPLAASCLLHQFDESNRRALLFQVDCSGSVSDRLYSIFGDFTPTSYKSVESLVQQIQSGNRQGFCDKLPLLYDIVCDSGDEDDLYNIEVCVVSESGVKRWSGSSVGRKTLQSTDHATTVKNLLPEAESKIEAN